MGGVRTFRPMADGATSAGRVPTVWRELWAFLHLPAILGPRQPLNGRAVRDVGWLLLLDLLCVLAIVLPLDWYSSIAGLPDPDLPLDEADGLLMVLLFGGLVAPVAEEILFRSWLRGVWPAVGWGLAGLSLMLVTGAIAAAEKFDEQTFTAMLAGGACAAVNYATWSARSSPARSEPPRWLIRSFAVLFWVQAALFALVHLTNYKEGHVLLVLPMVLPQLAGGIIYGYARVRYGMWACFALHVLHNTTLLSLLLIAGAEGAL